jgi:hypothetical protein
MTETTAKQEPIDLVISFDTTGSMYPCLAEVRRKVDETAKRLFREIPNLRIGIVAHGDYCDTDTYITKHLQLTNDANAVSYFVKNVESTYGGDFPECYELVLHEVANKMSWADGSKRVLAMIGDATPHPKAHNPGKLDWKEELDRLINQGVVVHGVQAMNRSISTSFYQELANRSGGAHLNLNQFNEATELLLAMAYHQQGPEAFEKYEAEVVAQKRMTRSLSGIFDKLSRRDTTTGRYRSIDARAVDAGRFQQIDVDADQPIKDVVAANGLVFKTGRGFYQFTKRETIQAKKEVVILDKETGDMYQGAAAREVLGLPVGESTDISPTFDKNKYVVFVQSTSNNRKLIGGTKFLYEAE